MLRSIVITLLYCTCIYAIPIDNGVEGDPEIECGPNTITVTMNTRNNFEGHVYVKGRYGEAGCRSDQTGKRTASISLPFSTCGIERQRSLNPKGIFIGVSVVISFHPQFLTKVDRAYSVQCFYMEADKTVSQDLEVSELTTAFQTQTVPMPICKYDILEGGPNGQPIKFAVIGQQVYHKWTCETESIDIFCMLVHTCNVDDGAGNKILVVNEQGCALDKFIINNLEYISDLMAGKEAHVFKFADRAALFFQCQVSISIKEPGEQCPRPQCPEANALGTEISGAYPGTSAPVPRSSNTPRPIGRAPGGSAPPRASTASPASRTKGPPSAQPLNSSRAPGALPVLANTARPVPAAGQLLPLAQSTSKTVLPTIRTTHSSSSQAQSTTGVPTTAYVQNTLSTSAASLGQLDFSAPAPPAPPAPGLNPPGPVINSFNLPTVTSATNQVQGQPQVQPQIQNPAPIPQQTQNQAQVPIQAQVPAQIPVQPQAQVPGQTLAQAQVPIQPQGQPQVQPQVQAQGQAPPQAPQPQAQPLPQAPVPLSTQPQQPQPPNPQAAQLQPPANPAPANSARPTAAKQGENGARFDFESTFPFRIRRVRAAHEVDFIGTWDVRAPALNTYEDFNNELLSGLEPSSATARSIDQSDLYCVPTLLIGLVIGVTLLSLLASIVVALFVCLRRRGQKYYVD